MFMKIRRYNMKRMFLICLSGLATAAALLIACLAVIPPAASAGGDTSWYLGSESDSEFTLSTADQLVGLADLVNGGINFSGRTITLDSDVELSAYGASYNGGEGWNPIGKSSAISFKGTFDGGGHKITGLFINRRAASYQSFFGFITGATIKNLGVEGVDVSGYQCVGGVVGIIKDGSIVSGCYSTGATSGDSGVGGVAGNIERSLVTGCYSTVDATGRSYVAGVVGYISFGGEVANCYSRGTTNGRRYVGGVTGYTIEGGVANCYSTGAIVAAEDSAGGVAGSIERGFTKNCASLVPSVAGNEFTGRVLGRNNGNSIELSGNVAFAGMLDGAGRTFPDGADDDLNGAGKTDGEIQEDGFFENLFGNDEMWMYIPGKLPILRGAGGYQTGYLPNHIPDRNPPTLSSGTANRLDDGSATVNFTSDEEGEYYNALTASGAPEPVIVTDGAGVPCDTSETTIALADIASGALDIYILVKDLADNVSEPLKMEIPACVAPPGDGGTAPTTPPDDAPTAPPSGGSLPDDSGSAVSAPPEGGKTEAGGCAAGSDTVILIPILAAAALWRAGKHRGKH
jgi:hypothetical protein